MGKEWLYWVGGGSAGRRARMAGETEAAAAASAGCMCAVFQLFDLNNFQLPLTAQHSEFKPDDSFLQEEATISKGVEAPRNSLELEEPAAAMKAASMSLSLAMKQEENLNFPVEMKIKTQKSRIPTSALKSRTDADVSSECSSYSPGTKTPNLVARLMGLDLLPECDSPSPKPKTKSHFLKNLRKTERTLLHSRSNRTFFDDDSSTGTVRSLPETPRISSARRSDFEIHRLSLQLNKENSGDEFGNLARSRRGSRFKVQDENISIPGSYAKQIVKQVKENVSRRVGVDITNRNRSEPIRRDENLVLLKPNKRSPTIFSRFGDDSTPSCSTNLRCLETTKNKPLADANTKSPRNSTSSDYSQSHGVSNSHLLPPKIQIVQEQQPQKDSKKLAIRGRSKSSSLKFLPPQGSDHGIKNKKEEPFVRSPAKHKARLTDKKCKKTPFSSDVFQMSAPILLPVKKDPSLPVTKLPQKQSQVSDALASIRRAQLSSKPSHSYKLQLHTDKIFDVLENVEPDSTNGCATAPSAVVEYENYIQKILRRTRKKWHSTSHPLDPTIFHYLELFQPTTSTTSAAVLRSRSNRKLIFQLVDELLGEILRPHFDFMKWASPITSNDHSSLVHELCKRIESFPAAKCEVLEDIDALIDRDLCNLPLQRSFEEEGDNIVSEIESEIMESLMRETMVDVGSGTAEESRQRVADVTWRLPGGEMALVGFIGPKSGGALPWIKFKREWN